MSINEYEFLKLIKANEDCPDDGFEFYCWAYKTKSSPCGTRACLVGNYLLQNDSIDYQWDGTFNFDQEEVMTALGISLKEFRYLFFNKVMVAAAGRTCGVILREVRPVSRYRDGWSISSNDKHRHLRRVKLFYHYKMKKAAMWQAWIDDHEKKQVECDNACLKAAEVVNAS